MEGRGRRRLTHGRRVPVGHGGLALNQPGFMVCVEVSTQLHWHALHRDVVDKLEGGLV